MKKLILILLLGIECLAIEQDKVYHLAAGAIVYYGCHYLLDFSEKECLLPVGIGAVGKEVYDGATGTGTVDFNDVSATIFVPVISYTITTW